jgi:predicted enzyme related to lactoylglutathione lyase
MATTDPVLTTSAVFDVADAAAAAAFWAALAGGTVGDGANAEYASVERPGATNLVFNLVPESKTVKNRMHLDLGVPDLQAAEQRATSLGAKVVARHDGWTTMQDPEGHEFCLVAE